LNVIFIKTGPNTPVHKYSAALVRSTIL
jgi:hypothetical protein